MNNTTEKPIEEGQCAALRSGDLFGVFNAPAPEDGTNRMEVTIAFPANWLAHIERMAEEAFRGDLYWLKQLMAKIVIASMPRSTDEPYSPNTKT